MADKRWYAVHTYSGFENKAKKSLEEKIRMEGLQDSFGEIPSRSSRSWRW